MTQIEELLINVTSKLTSGFANWVTNSQAFFPIWCGVQALPRLRVGLGLGSADVECIRGQQ